MPHPNTPPKKGYNNWAEDGLSEFFQKKWWKTLAKKGKPLTCLCVIVGLTTTLSGSTAKFFPPQNQKKNYYCWWFRNPANQLMGSLSHSQVSWNPRWWLPDFWINSITSVFFWGENGFRFSWPPSSLPLGPVCSILLTSAFWGGSKGVHPPATFTPRKIEPY